MRAGGWPKLRPQPLRHVRGDSAQDLGDELSERSRGDAFGGGGGAGPPNLLGAMAPFSWSASGSFVPACQREMDKAAAFGTKAAAAAGVAGGRGGASAKAAATHAAGTGGGGASGAGIGGLTSSLASTSVSSMGSGSGASA